MKITVKNRTGIDSIKNRKEFIINKKIILQTQQRFTSERRKVFAEEINKISLTSYDDKRMQSIDSIETYAYGTRKDLISEKEETKCNNKIKRYKK